MKLHNLRVFQASDFITEEISNELQDIESILDGSNLPDDAKANIMNSARTQLQSWSKQGRPGDTKRVKIHGRRCTIKLESLKREVKAYKTLTEDFKLDLTKHIIRWVKKSLGITPGDSELDQILRMLGRNSKQNRYTPLRRIVNFAEALSARGDLVAEDEQFWALVEHVLDEAGIEYRVDELRRYCERFSDSLQESKARSGVLMEDESADPAADINAMPDPSVVDEDDENKTWREFIDEQTKLGTITEEQAQSWKHALHARGWLDLKLKDVNYANAGSANFYKKLKKEIKRLAPQAIRTRPDLATHGQGTLLTNLMRKGGKVGAGVAGVLDSARDAYRREVAMSPDNPLHAGMMAQDAEERKYRAYEINRKILLIIIETIIKMMDERGVLSATPNPEPTPEPAV